MRETFSTPDLVPEESPKESAGVNFYEVAEERRKLRRAVAKLGEKKDAFGQYYKGPLEEVQNKSKDFSIKDFGSLTEAKKVLEDQKGEYEERILKDRQGIDSEAILATTPGLKEVQEVLEHISELKDFQMKRMLESLGTMDRFVKKINNGILESVRKDIKKDEEKLAETEPLLLRQAELVEYKEDLVRPGHICITPSVEKDLEAIGDRMLTGKPMFLHGPTGTGKTSLARFASVHFTGKDPEMVFCSPQTKESNVWGKTAVDAARNEKGELTGAVFTYLEFGPLTRALKEGKTVIFDEFTALPKEQMVFIKAVFALKPGDKINIAGDGMIEVASEFQAVFTANLKSKKNQERQDLPPEIAREFEQNNLEVRYTPPDEAYDIMLSRLMNPDGTLDMSYHDLRTTLPTLCQAMAEIQESYTKGTDTEVARRAGALDAGNKTHSLEKFVMTQGSVEAILQAWLVEKQIGSKSRCFAEFLDERFKTALTFKEYSEADRILVAKILASKGFLTTLTAKDLDLPEDIFKLNTIKQMRGEDAVEELRKKSGAVKHLSLKEVALLDPFNKRAEQVQDQAEGLLGDEAGKDQFLNGLDKKAGRLFGNKKGGEKLDLDQIKVDNEDFLKEVWFGKDSKIEQKPILLSPSDADWGKFKDDIDKDKYGEYTVNPDTQNLDWETLKDKIFIPDPQEFTDCTTVKDVADRILQKYAGKYQLPGLEYWKFMIQNPDKVPTQLKDGNYYFNFGSLVRNSDGRWDVPFARWNGSEWNRHAYWLDNSWYSDYRVVLLKI